MKKEKEYRLSEGEKVSYSFGDCAGQIYVTLATYFLTGYYTDTVGISALAVGTMMLVARVFDGTTDLVMGAVIDRTRSRHGKARAWILWTTPLMAVALVALFSVPSSMSGDGKLIYAYFTYILLNCIIYTANGIAYNSLLSRMTLNVQDRCSASSLRFVLGNLAAMTVVTMAYNIPTILGSLINPLLVAKMGKRKVLIICFATAIAGRVLVGAAGTSFVVLLAGVAVHGFALGPVYSNVFAMTADIVDYGEWKTGIRSEGLVTCCVSFGMKVGLGLGSAVATWVLAYGGYVGTAAVQSAAAESAIRFGFGYLSAVLSAVCLILAVVMDLDKDIEKIQADLMQKHGR